MESIDGWTLPVYVIYARGHMIRSTWIHSESVVLAELHIYMHSRISSRSSSISFSLINLGSQIFFKVYNSIKSCSSLLLLFSYSLESREVILSLFFCTHPPLPLFSLVTLVFSL